jgi:tripartite ATP-independent transporter DctM subunit
MIMAGISGSASADAAALGSVMIPAMRKEGYPAEVAAAINAAAATMGPIIPPSIMMIVYGAYSNLSISALFLGGALPGIFIGLSLMCFVYVWAVKTKFPKNDRRASAKQIWTAFKGAILALLAPIIIVTGVVGGIFTATEAGMIVTIYCLIVTGLIYRTLNLKMIKAVLGKTLEGMAQPLLCVAAAGSFGYVMAYLKVPAMVLVLAAPIAHSQIGVLLFIVTLYIILGTFMDATPAIIIFMSIIQTLSQAVGLNPYHVGDLIVIVMCIGFITPPYGLTLLISSGIAGVTPTAVCRELRWIYVVLLGVILVLAFFPEIILFLPRLVMPMTIGPG